MPTGAAYSSGHLVPFNLRLAYVLFVDINLLPELVVIFPDYALRASLGTFALDLHMLYLLGQTSPDPVPLTLRLVYALLVETNYLHSSYLGLTCSSPAI